MEHELRKVGTGSKNTEMNEAVRTRSPGFGIFTLVMVAAFIGLGLWQLQRRVEKHALIAALDERLAAAPVPLPAASQWSTLAPDRDEFRRVSFTATYEGRPDAMVYSSGSAIRADISGPGTWAFLPARLPAGETVAVNAGFVLFAYRVLTVGTPPARQLWAGALTASVLWQILQSVGTYLVEHQLRGATATYGLFGIVLGLLTWLYLAALILVLGAEINVVRVRRLYPRSLLAPDPTDTALTHADRRAYTAYTRTERQKDNQTVETEFTPSSNSPDP